MEELPMDVVAVIFAGKKIEWAMTSVLWVNDTTFCAEKSD